ncbi:MAG: hypothetical protein WC947_10755, partial [Elusimicrobiota bacterium]
MKNFIVLWYLSLRGAKRQSNLSFFRVFVFSWFILTLISLPQKLHSNNVQIGSLYFSTNSANTIMDISFSVSQENTLSTFSAIGTPEEVKDCVWVFVKYSTNGVGG